MFVADERAANLTVIFTGDLHIPTLGIGSGYVGSILPTQPQRLMRDASHPLVLDVEMTDSQVRMIEDRRSTTGDGGFDLSLNLRFTTIDPDSKISHGSGSLQPHRFTRDAWLEGLRQIGFRHVQVIELEEFEAEANPNLATALEFFKTAQTRYFDGDYREVAEALRQSLNALVGKSADEEADIEELEKELRDAQKEAFNAPVGYDRRVELVRKGLKFTADIGAHPEADSTNRYDALALLHMTAGVIQWFGKH